MHLRPKLLLACSVTTFAAVAVLIACGGSETTDDGPGATEDGGSDGAVATGNNDGAPSDAGATFACATPPLTIVHESGYVQQTLALHTVDVAASPAALCNDGTPALYAVRPGYGGGARRWVISLEGGGSCYDATTCRNRRNNTTSAVGTILTTSSMNLAAVPNHGILASDPSFNPDFYDANEVRVHYCSSDAWQGNHAGVGTFAADDPTTWSFQGHAIVAAVVKELLAGGMKDADEVVLEGESGGGAGVFTNANAVAQMLPSHVRFVAISDAAFAIDVAGYDASAPNGISAEPPPYPNAQRLIEAEQLWAGTGDSTCVKSHDAGDPACSSGQLLLDSHAFAMPVFVRQSLLDNQKMGELNAPDPDSATGKSASAQAYFAWYKDQQRTAMHGIPSPYSVFGPDITDHIDLLGGDSTGPFTYTTPIFAFDGGTSLSTQQAISTWYANPCYAQQWVQ